MKNFHLSSDENILCHIIGNPSQFNSNYKKFFIKQPDNDRLFKLAEQNELTGVNAHVLLNDPKKKTSCNKWEEVHSKTKSRLISYLEELDQISELLSMNNISVVALKNARIARGIYPCLGCCPMGDIDVMVSKHQFQEAHRIIQSEGYNFEFRLPLVKVDLQPADASGVAEIAKWLKSDIFVDSCL